MGGGVVHLGGVLKAADLVDEGVRFAADLYRGTAASYERYRLAYPEAMLGDLISRVSFPSAAGCWIWLLGRASLRDRDVRL